MDRRAGGRHHPRRRSLILTWPQAEHADLGLIEDDHTPDMRKAPMLHPTKNASTEATANDHEGIESYV